MNVETPAQKALTTTLIFPYILQKILQSSISYRYKGLPVFCRMQDRCAITDVFFEANYDPNNFGVPFDWRQCKRIVDVGAHIGTFTVFAQVEAPDATVESYEPSDIFEVLRKNAGRAIIHNVAVAAENGFETFHTHESGGSSLVRAGGRESTASTVALRDILSSPVDYLKMDCEGGEYEALYSLSKKESDNIKFLGLEYHHFSADAGHRPQALFLWLLSRGFTIKLHRKSMLFAWHSDHPEIIAPQSYYDSLP